MKLKPLLIVCILSSAVALVPLSGFSAFDQEEDLAKKLRDLDARILTKDNEQAKIASNMLWDDIRARLKEANQRETKNWRNLKTLGDWEKYRNDRLDALRTSLGKFPLAPEQVKIHVTKTIPGNGFQIKNIAYESRPGLLVTANLYLPEKKPEAMPGIIIIHSHHNPKTQGELQDMGMLWARLGCAVLVPDQLGHGERRQHPFINEKSYSKPFKAGRQDYYFRYNESLQLYLTGESLMGWMVWDLMRGVDVLKEQPGIDTNKIILMGSVAGGGDPCAVTAALDKRITAAVPFNFGGPQPETTFPLPPDAEDRFNYAGGGSWESTRNLRLSAGQGFMPWVIVGAISPRGLSYAHEFAWDRENDPVWKRLEKIYDWYKAPNHLSFTHGKGKVTGPGGPDNTHCNNIGAVHRKMIYPALKTWFDIPIPQSEKQERLNSAELLCLTPELAKKNQPLYALAHALGKKQVEAARKELSKLPLAKRQEKMRQAWSQLLGGINSKIEAKKISVKDSKQVDSVKMEHLVINTERDIQVPALLLTPTGKTKQKLPVVVALAQQGHQGFLKNRSEAIAELLKKGVAVCLPDVRGSGETQMGTNRGRSSSATSLSATELMLGGTILGGQCQDLLAVVHYLRTRAELNPERIALWGDSFAPLNGKERNLAVPLDAADLPEQAEPIGATLALLGALFDERICAVQARGGVGSYLSALQSHFIYLPHDAIIPGVLTSGDVCDLAGTLAPRPIRLEGMVDGLNQAFSLTAKDNPFEPALEAYRGGNAEKSLQLVDQPGFDGKKSVGWLVAELTR